MDVDWTFQLAEQFDWHWRNALRPRLEGLTDAEYAWEPVPGCWSVLRRAESTAPRAVGSGDFVFEFAYPAPEPAPMTTIAWRLAHITVNCLGERNTDHFGGPETRLEGFAYAGTAAEALDQLDAAAAYWIAAVRKLDAAALAAPCGPAEDPFGHEAMAMLVLHVNREVVHHGAEVALLRDLYQHQPR